MSAKSVLYIKSKHKIILYTILFLISFLYCLVCHPQEIGPSGELKQSRPANWAAQINKEGLPNFYKVTDNLYRGAQPLKNGIAELKKLGIKTIINLRLTNTDAELISGSGLKYYFLPVNTLSPDEYKFSRFLEIISDPANCPVFVHCRRGADRTGVAIALYRIKIQKWTVNDAINEMENGGFHFNTLYFNLKSLIRNFEK